MAKLCICIEKAEDGTFSVYQEDKEEEGMPEMGGMKPMDGMQGKPPMAGMSAMGSEVEGYEDEDKPNAQPAASLEEALMIASQMLSADSRSPEEAMMAGYNKGGQSAMQRPTPGKVFGDE